MHTCLPKHAWHFLSLWHVASERGCKSCNHWKKDFQRIILQYGLLSSPQRNILRSWRMHKRLPDIFVAIEYDRSQNIHLIEVKSRKSANFIVRLQTRRRISIHFDYGYGGIILLEIVNHNVQLCAPRSIQWTNTRVPLQQVFRLFSEPQRDEVGG